MRVWILITLALAATLGVAACGESKQDKAGNQVCSARSDLQKQVNELKEQVQDATRQFTSALSSIGSDLGQSLSAADAKTQLQTALQQLATAYQKSFAKVDC